MDRNERNPDFSQLGVGFLGEGSVTKKLEPQEGACPRQAREAGNSSKKDTSLLVLKEEVAQREVENGNPDHGRMSIRTGWSPN